MDKILIVDDEASILEALQRLLRKDYEIFTTVSAFEAFKLLQAHSFAVILSDQRMPEMSGVDLLEKAKLLQPLTTRILLTGYTDIEAVIEAINRGHIYRYIAKPWDPTELALTVKRAAENYHLRTEIEEKNVALEAANLELRQALEQLKGLDRAKARFLSLISHELNTPLTVLNSFLELLSAEKDSLSGDLKTAVGSLQRASESLSQVVLDVLDFVKLEVEAPLQKTSVHLMKEIKAAEKKLEKALKAKGLKIEVSGDLEAVVEGDPEKLATFCRHLLKDACEKANSKTSLQVSLRRENSTTTIQLSRDGEKISKEAFQPLVPGENLLHHHRGLGLSLAICRVIAELHQGDLQLVSSDSKRTVICANLPH